MKVLQFKQGVSLVGLQPEALIGISGCLTVFDHRSLPMTLTSCRDGKHSNHSHHYKGLAWDIRIWDIEDVIDEVCAEIRGVLGADYQVLDEHNHIHVEFDPK